MDSTLVKELQEFVDQHLNIVSSHLYESEEIIHDEIENFIKLTRKPSFIKVLFDFIDQKGSTDLEVYKKARIDRRHFSKIRSNPDYRISKRTAISLAFALELTKSDTETLLSAAGFSLSNHDTFDLVIQFCLEKALYNLDTVNEALDHFSLKPLA